MREKRPDRDNLLREAYRGATPLDKKEREPYKARVRVKMPDAGGLSSGPSLSTKAGARRAKALRDDIFTFEIEEDFIQGFRNGQNRRKLKRELRDFRSHGANTLDLHGNTRDEAEGRLRRFLSEAYGRGIEQVLIIFGKGTHSPHGISRLRDLVLSVLQEPETRASLRGTLTAPQRLGGTGALLVILARAPGF